MTSLNDEEVWALCRAPRKHLYRLRYTLEAYEGLCLATTPPGRQGFVWLRTSRGLRGNLEEVLASLAREMDLAVLGWGTGEPVLPPGGVPPSVFHP